MHYLRFYTGQGYENCPESLWLAEALFRAFYRHLTGFDALIPRFVCDSAEQNGLTALGHLAIIQTEVDCSHLMPLSGQYRLVGRSPLRGNDSKSYTHNAEVLIYPRDIDATLPMVEYMPLRPGGATNWTRPCLEATVGGITYRRSVAAYKPGDADMMRSAIASIPSGPTKRVMNVLRPDNLYGYATIDPDGKAIMLSSNLLWSSFLDGNLDTVLKHI